MSTTVFREGGISSLQTRRFVPNAEHVLKELIPSEDWVTQLKPQPYNDNGKMQMIHH